MNDHEPDDGRRCEADEQLGRFVPGEVGEVFRFEHRGANEYLGQLYLKTGKMKEAQAQLAKLQKICGKGCEEYESLRTAIAKAGGRS